MPLKVQGIFISGQTIKFKAIAKGIGGGFPLSALLTKKKFNIFEAGEQAEPILDNLLLWLWGWP